MGVTGTQINAGRITDLDQNSEVRDEKWIGTPTEIGIGDKMIRDPAVYRSHHTVIDPLRDAFWDVDAASKSALDMEVADFLSHNLFERIRWADHIAHACRFLRRGVALFEMTDEMGPISRERFPLHPGNGRALLLTGLHERPASTVHEWVPSKADPTRLAAIRQWGPGGDAEPAGIIEIPADRLHRLTWEQEGANFRGLAMGRIQYGAWKAKRLLMILLMIAHEKFAVPTPVITLPDGSTVGQDELDQVELILKAYKSNNKGYVVLPGNWKFALESLDSTEHIQAAIDWCDFQILMVFGAPHEKLGQNGTGSHALAGTQKSGNEITTASVGTFITDCLNLGSDDWSVVKRLVRENYGPDVALPRVVARSLPTRDWSKFFPQIRNLGEIGFLTPGHDTEEFLRDVAALPRESRPYVKPGTRTLTNANANATAKAEADPAKEAA